MRWTIWPKIPEKSPPAEEPAEEYELAYEPQLLPPPALMHEADFPVLEEWFRWAEEWSVLLRVYAGLGKTSSVLDIGCGLGRIAFPLRYVLTEGTYLGFDVNRRFVAFAQERFSPVYPHFRFVWADIRNTYYNPEGAHLASEYRFPCEDASLDIAFAASVFTHMVPENTRRYFQETARALKAGGKCLFSFFVLDHYRRGQARPFMFGQPDFDFDHTYADYSDRFAISHPENPELMTAYSVDLIRELAASVGLHVARPVLPGLWSGRFDNWTGVQDLIVLGKPR
jgi:SAM-dependent methyltransferase